MSNFDEILNQGKKKEEAKAQQEPKELMIESPANKDKSEWAEEQKKKRD